MERTLRTLFWLGLTLYLGGMIALGAIAAPVLFHTLSNTQVTVLDLPPGLDHGRMLAGRVFGNILKAFTPVEIASLLLMIIPTALLYWRTRAASLTEKRRRWVLPLLLAGLTVTLVLDVAWSTPPVWREREAWIADIRQNQIPEANAHRQQFDIWHKRSEAIGKTKIAFLAAILLIAAIQPQNSEKK